MKLHAGDQVVIISGKDKGKVGKVLRVLKNDRIVVSDVNMRTKHIKSQPNKQGQIIKYEASFSRSNVMLVDPRTKKRSRVGFKIDDKGVKTRIAKRSGDTVVAVAAKDIKKDVKETKETKEVKEEKEATKAKESKATTERREAPKKSPFWKGLGFGKEAMEDADVKDESHMKEDRSVPDQGKTPDTFTHKRGG